MHKPQLIEALAESSDLNPYQAERVLNNLIGIIYRETGKGERVVISGFGIFSVSHRAPRIGVNPQNPSQKIMIPELLLPKFRAGEAFKKAVGIKLAPQPAPEPQPAIVE